MKLPPTGWTNSASRAFATVRTHSQPARRVFAPGAGRIQVWFWRSVGTRRTVSSWRASSTSSRTRRQGSVRVPTLAPRQAAALQGALELAAEKATGASAAGRRSPRIAVVFSFGSWCAQSRRFGRRRWDPEGASGRRRGGLRHDGEPRYRQAPDRERDRLRAHCRPLRQDHVQGGRVEQSNFHDYACAHERMPKVEVHIVPSKEAPGESANRARRRSHPRWRTRSSPRRQAHPQAALLG